jgi:hypothetical protein
MKQEPSICQTTLGIQQALHSTTMPIAAARPDLAKRDRFIVIPSHALKHDVVGTLAEEPLAAQRKTRAMVTFENPLCMNLHGTCSASN